MKTSIKYQVEQLIDGKWIAAWTQVIDNVSSPLLFDTDEEARDEMIEHVQEVFDETGQGVASDFRVQPVTVHDPAPLYNTGFRFKSKALGNPSLDFIITYRYHNGVSWCYHVARDLGPVCGQLPAFASGQCDGSDYMDLLTLQEWQIKSIRSPESGEPSIYVIKRGFGAMTEYWHPTLGWTNRLHAWPLNKDELPTTNVDGGYWEIVQ